MQGKSEIPRIKPPDPYNSDGQPVIKYIADSETFTADGDGVFLPYWYWEKLFDYIVDTQTMQEINSVK